MRTANHSLGPAFEEISLPASTKWDSPVICVCTRTTVHGQSLQAHTSLDILSLLVGFLEATTCGAVDTYQTNLRACLWLHKSDLWPNKTQMQGGPCLPITAIRALHVSVCRNYHRFRPYPKATVLPHPQLQCRQRRRRQSMHGHFKAARGLREPGCWPPGLARHTRSPGHCAAGTLPASGTRKGTTPEEEALFFRMPI